VRDVVQRRIDTANHRLGQVLIQLRERSVRLVAAREEKLKQYPIQFRRTADTAADKATQKLQRQVTELQKVPRVIERQMTVLQERERLLGALRPERMLERGYSITRDASGKILRDVKQVGVGDKVNVQLAGGSLQAEVLDTKESDNNG
jgi:exodeoxyribonuclease VII large subunit